ncbi:MAG: hypothetical protein AAGA24_07145, partial [Pseudomonadota bacterium]
MIEIESGAAAVRTPTFLLASVFDSAGVISSTGGGTVENALDGVTYDFWALTATSGSAQIVLSAAEAADTLCIAAHDLGTQGATITVEYDNGGGFTVLGQHTPTDDSAIMLLMPSAMADTWRVSVTGAVAAPTIGVMMLGERLTIPRGLTDGYTKTAWGREIELLTGITRSGQFLGNRIIRQSGQIQVSPGLIDRTWWDANGVALQRHY